MDPVIQAIESLDFEDALMTVVLSRSCWCRLSMYLIVSSKISAWKKGEEKANEYLNLSIQSQAVRDFILEFVCFLRASELSFLMSLARGFIRSCWVVHMDST